MLTGLDGRCRVFGGVGGVNGFWTSGIVQLRRSSRRYLVPTWFESHSYQIYFCIYHSFLVSLGVIFCGFYFLYTSLQSPHVYTFSSVILSFLCLCFLFVFLSFTLFLRRSMCDFSSLCCFENTNPWMSVLGLLKHCAKMQGRASAISSKPPW